MLLNRELLAQVTYALEADLALKNYAAAKPKARNW